MLNNPPPSPAKSDAVTVTFTLNFCGSIIALAEPETNLSNCRSVNASAGMLNKPLPSPL